MFLLEYFFWRCSYRYKLAPSPPTSTIPYKSLTLISVSTISTEAYRYREVLLLSHLHLLIYELLYALDGPMRSFDDV